VRRTEKANMRVGEYAGCIATLFYVDSLFSTCSIFELVKGNRETVLLRPNSILLTESSAKQLFGAEDPMVNPYKDMEEIP
jgi:putative ABC transport system permease protein